jgi:hypothetical protein
LFVCFESHEQLFSNLATVTITGDRTANLDLCLALTAFSSKGSFTCHTYCDVFKVISKKPVILTSECHALGEGAITTYFKRLRFDAVGPSRARTHDLPIAKRGHYHYVTATGHKVFNNCQQRMVLIYDKIKNGSLSKAVRLY